MSKKLIYKVVIPARANSKRLPGKNMKLLGNKPLVEYSIDYALNVFDTDDVWINSDDLEVIALAKKKGIQTLLRPKELASDNASTVEVLKFQVEYFSNNNISCDALILLQPTNPFREQNLLIEAISKFDLLNLNSLATFSVLDRKIGSIENDQYRPINYTPGQRSQDMENLFFENGLLYIASCESILNHKIITEDVYPIICSERSASVDIDYLEDFKFAESLLTYKDEKEPTHNNKQ